MKSFLNGPDGKRRPYSTLSDTEKLQYHTHVYAFRIVYLGVPETQHSWDGDPEGIWFNPDLVAREVMRLLKVKAKQDGSERREKKDIRDDQVIKAQRAAFIKLKGFRTWEQCDQAMWDEAQANAHPITGQANVVGTMNKKGSLHNDLINFCTKWRDDIIRERMKAQFVATAKPEDPT